jgi:hypothetical protein
MEQILVSNIISEKIGAATGREAFVLSLDIVNQWTKGTDFKLIAILRDKETGNEERLSFTPKSNGTPKLSFSSAIIKVDIGKELHFQLESEMPMLGNLSYRFF